METLTRPYARSTRSHFTTLQTLGLALGGNAGARIAAELRIPGSASTLLRRVHATQDPPSSPVRVLGVDDWALRKGQQYGTILCDLERGCPIDLLADRSAESLAAWLRNHPEIEILSRDRGGVYAEGARMGAPQAQQVADRFHLLQNMTEVLRRVLDRHFCDLKHACERAEAESLASVPPQQEEGVPDPPALQKEAPPDPPAPAPTAARLRREAFFQEVQRLTAEGHSLRAIARKLDVSRVTVKRYAQAQTTPPFAGREHPVSRTVLAGYTDLIDQRAQEGVPSIQHLVRQLHEAGYTGGEGRVYAYLKKHPAQASGRRASATQHRGLRLSARAATWLLLRPPQKLEAQEQRLRECLLEANEEVAHAYRLIERFAAMVRKRQSEQLDAWLEDAKSSSIAELVGFAKSLAQDYAAVRAGLTLPWSNGPVEGQVNRLKLLKRSMYGRAGIPLLRKRLLCAR
ncbi:MAG: ISL3 family transposase [Acidobacteriaceae bacterium]